MRKILIVKKSLLIILAHFCIINIMSQENIKTGWTFGALPAVAYDSDLGFRYGALVNLFYYGDGSTYPDYLHSLYYELSTTTKGSTLSKFYWDTDRLTKNYYLRLTTSFNIINDRAFDFYGVNGYEANYNPVFEDDEDPLYRSRMFYRMERQRTNFIMDFQGGIIESKLRWIAGYSYFNYQLGSVNINKLNEGKPEDEKLPSTTDEPGVYEYYKNYDLLAQDKYSGGQFNLFKLGLVLDTRNVESNPNTGLWTELQIISAPEFMSPDDISFSKLSLIHRQYIPIIKSQLTLAYRIGFQHTITGHTPFYVQPYIFESWPNSAYSEGIGGAKNVRGILRNRVIGDGIAYGNIEFRWKFHETIIRKQNVYFALAPFLDGGMVTQKIQINKSQLPDNVSETLFTSEPESLHLSGGCGFYTAINENFIISVMYGKAFRLQDGDDGLYINVNFLY